MDKNDFISKVHRISDIKSFRNIVAVYALSNNLKKNDKPFVSKTIFYILSNLILLKGKPSDLSIIEDAVENIIDIAIKERNPSVIFDVTFNILNHNKDDLIDIALLNVSEKEKYKLLFKKLAFRSGLNENGVITLDVLNKELDEYEKES